jgi:hypothetical protein
VVLEGLDIDGGSPSSPGLNGVRILAAGEVIINDCVIRNFVQASNGVGIVVQSSTKTRVTIQNSLINNNLYGIRIGGGSVNNSHIKMFNTSIIANSVAGLSVSGAGNDALIAGNQFIGPKSLEILSGAAITSYGNNVLTSGDAPTTVLPLG